MMDITTRFALEDLLNEFTYAADRRDYEAMQGCFHTDAVDDHGAYHGPIQGYIDWLKIVQESWEMSSHVITNMRFVVDGDRAETEARGTTYLRIKADKPFNLLVIARHFDKYERRCDQWRFINRSLCVDWFQLFPPGESNIGLVGAIQRGRMGKDDPVYSRLQLLPTPQSTITTDASY